MQFKRLKFGCWRMFSRPLWFISPMIWPLLTWNHSRVKFNIIKLGIKLFITNVGNFKADKNYGHVSIILGVFKKVLYICSCIATLLKITSGNNFKLFENAAWYRRALCKIQPVVEMFRKHINDTDRKKTTILFCFV